MSYLPSQILKTQLEFALLVCRNNKPSLTNSIKPRKSMRGSFVYSNIFCYNKTTFPYSVNVTLQMLGSCRSFERPPFVVSCSCQTAGLFYNKRSFSFFIIDFSLLSNHRLLRGFLYTKNPQTNVYGFFGKPTVRGYNAPCFEGMVHFWGLSIDIHRTMGTEWTMLIELVRFG